VRADPDLTPLAFMLAYMLADLVNEREGCAWPGIAHLAAECHVTEKGIKKIIRSLVEHGHLHVEVCVGRGRTNRYRWNIKLEDARGGASHAHDDRGVLPSSRRDAPQVPISGQKGATRVPRFDAEKGNCGSEKGELAFQKRGTPVPPTLFNESIYDPPERSSARQQAQISSIGFDDFWRVHPKKVDRGQALRAFEKASENAPFEDIVLGAMRYATERAGQAPRFTKHPATWLTKACRTDPTLQSFVEPRQRSRRFNGSVLERMHTDTDFTEVLTSIQTLHRGRK
jgi:Helix-turn-helix domain